MVSGRNVVDLTNEELDRAIATVRGAGLEIVSIASPLLKCVLPEAPEVDGRFQQDVFASRQTFEDQPRLAARTFEIAERAGARIVRVFSYWRTVRPRGVLRTHRRRARRPGRGGRAARADRGPGERARLQHRHRRGDRAGAGGAGPSQPPGGVGSRQRPGFRRDAVPRRLPATAARQDRPRARQGLPAGGWPAGLGAARRGRDRLARPGGGAVARRLSRLAQPGDPLGRAGGRQTPRQPDLRAEPDGGSPA